MGESDGTDNFHGLHVFWRLSRRADRIYAASYRDGPHQGLARGNDSVPHGGGQFAARLAK